MVALRLGGITTDALPDNLYYDGIDQTSYLLTKDGRSLRQAVFLWSGTEFCAVRWKDYKIHFQIFDTKDARRNLDASLLSKVPYPWVFNLNVDPKDQASEGHRRFEWGIPAVIAIQKRHLETVKKYPNTDLGLSF
jgi:arylsulfatase